VTHAEAGGVGNASWTNTILLRLRNEMH
jgi:hypothetical protein